MNHLEPEVRLLVVFFRRIARDRDARRAMDRSVRRTLLDLDGVGVIGDRFEEMLIMALALLECVFGPMPLDGISDRAGEHMRIDFAFDQIILRSFSNGLDRHRFIVGPAQHNHRHRWRLGVQSLEGLKSLAVWKGQIGQNDVKIFMAEFGQRISQSAHAGPGEVHGLAFAEQQLEQPGIDRTVFDQQYFDGCFHAQAVIPVRSYSTSFPPKALMFPERFTSSARATSRSLSEPDESKPDRTRLRLYRPATRKRTAGQPSAASGQSRNQAVSTRMSQRRDHCARPVGSSL